MTETSKRTLIVQPIPNCDPIIGVALWGLEDARQRTRETLHGLNPMGLDWRLQSGGHTITTLLYHIAAIELDWLYTEVLESKPSQAVSQLFPHDVRDPAGRLTIVTGESVETLWTRLDKVRALLLDAYKAMTLEDYRRVRVLAQYNVTPEWVLHHLMQHEAEHRDELRRLREHAENEVV